VYSAEAPNAVALRRVGLLRLPTYFKVTVAEDGNVTIVTHGKVKPEEVTQILAKCRGLGFIEED
jgi:hypothetical protein